MRKIKWMINRRRVLLGLFTLILLVGLVTPISLGADSIPQDIVAGQSEAPIERSWFFADSPEYPIIENNLEDFIDILTDLHPDSDIGSHSNPLTLRIFDGIFDTMTSDNITIPESEYYDEIENTTIIIPEYTSWRLDLEGGWTDIDHNEVNGELCIFAGTQADDPLRVDVWSDGSWVNIIERVQTGWNNVSVASSLVNNTLEVRFKNTDKSNTSVQSSWEIDCVLLHTWTTIYESEYTQNGLVQRIGDDLFRYCASVGEVNTYNEETGTWHRYLYDPDAKSVKIGNLTITHLPRGALSIDGETGSQVGRLSWYIQAYYNDVWNNITLSTYQFVGFTKTTENVTAHQRFWGPQGEMNVYLTYSYFGGFKTRVEIRNDAAQDVPIRAIWAAQNVRGIQDNYELLYDENDVLCGIQIEDAVFNWGDVIVSDNPLPIQTAIDKPNRRAAVIFGDQSTVIPSGYTTSIDPEYTITSDAYDNYWDYTGDPDGTDVDTAVHNKIDTTDDFGAIFGVPVTIAPYSIVTEATLTVFVESRAGEQTVRIQRIDSADMPAIDNGNDSDGTAPSAESGLYGYIEFASAGWDATSGDIGELVQHTLNEAGWASGNIMGFRLQATGDGVHTIEDYQDSSLNHPSVTITFSAAATNWLTGYTYRQGHSIDGSTGAGTLYPIKINVEYGIGTSGDGTIYCNEHSDTDFDDIRFTDDTGNTELDYWLEEKTDSDDATFWVEVSTDLGSDQVIYVYYGKSGDSSDSDGEATFLLFDDFEDNNLDNWADTTNMEIASDRTHDGSSYSASWTSSGNALLQDNTYAGISGIRISFWNNIEDTLRGSFIYVYSEDDYSENVATVRSAYETGTSPIYYRDTGVYVPYPGSADDLNDDEWDKIEFSVDFASDKMQTWQNGVANGQLAIVEDDGSALETQEVDGMGLMMQSGSQVWFDDVIVRKWVVTEPSPNCWGREQSQPPMNDQTPTLDNPSDTDNMYAHYVKYQITVYVSSPNGFAFIDYLEIGLWNDARDTEYWRGRYTESGDVFSEVYDIGTVVVLDTGSSTATESGNDIDATFYITVDWDFPDQSDLDTKCYVVDSATNSDEDGYETTMDVETRLDYSTFSFSDENGDGNRGDYDDPNDIHVDGTVVYYGSSLVLTTALVDVWVLCPDVGTGWMDGSLSSGVFALLVPTDDVVGLDTYTIKIVQDGAGSDGDDEYYTTSRTETYIADYMTFIATTSKTWTVVGEEITVTLSGKYAYDNLDVPSMVWTTMDSGSVSYETVGLREWNYTSSGDTYGITKYFTTNASCIWDDVVFTSGPSYYWSQESPERVWFIWGVASAYEWDYNNSAVQDGFLIQSIVNDTNNAYATTYGGSIGGLAIGVFGPEYYTANITITIDIGDYLLTLWYQTVTVDILHSLQIVNFNLVPTDYYFWLVYQTNKMNASITIWDDVVNSGTLFSDRIYHSNYEGMHQIPVDDTVGNHNYTICITSYATHYDKDFTSDDYVWWYNFTNVVPEAPTVYETNIVFVDSLGRVIEFDTFDVYKNGSRLYASVTVTYSNLAYNITVNDRWGETLNSTVFDTGDHEFVLVVDVYSLKVMSWHEDFVFFNITHGGLTYTEVITPMDTIEFELFAGTYDWVVDYRNETTVEGETTLTGSTAIIITGSTIADVAGYSATLLEMTTEINVTITATNNYVLTISIDLDNINTTINEQLIQVLLNITNTNSTIYSQAVDLLAYIQTVNSTLFDQTVSIITELTFISSNITANYILLSNSLIAIDSNLYSNFTSVTSTLSAIGSNITTNYLAVSATLLMIDSQLLSNFTAIVAQLVSVNSSIASQFITIIANVAELNTTMYLVDDPTHLNPLVLGSSLSDDYCDFTVVTNWHNSSISIYDNNVLRTGPTSELLSPIRYPLMSTSGTHNLSVFVDGGTDSFWYNISYTIVETAYGETTIKAYYSSGIGIEDIEDKFIIYVNGSRTSDSFYNDTSSTYEICVTDFFGNEIYNDTHDWAKFIDIEFDYYTLKVYSQIQSMPIYFTLTRGGSTISEYLGIGEILRYYLAAGTYTYRFIKGSTPYTGELELGVDYYYVVTDLDLWDLWNQPKGGGGDDDAMELYILQVLSFGILGLFGFMFLVQIPSIMNFLSGRQPRPSSTGDRRRRQ